MTKQILILILLVSCSFGRVTTDTVKAGVGEFSGTLTGATLNTGNGANELYPMDQDQRTTASPTHVLGTFTNGCRAYNTTEYGTYIGLFKGVGALPGYPSNCFPVLKTDHDYLFFSTLNKYSGAVGAEYFEIRDTAVPTKLKFLVYHDTTTARIIKADSLQLGSGSYLKTYVEGTFPCTLKTSDVTVQQVGTISYTVIGNVIVLKIPVIGGESNSTILRLYSGSIPSIVAPNNDQFIAVSGIKDNGISGISGSLSYSAPSKMFIIYKYDLSPYASSGSKGIGRQTTVSYTK